MLQTVEGIILRSINYSESSIICDVYTKEHGLRTYIVNGVRQAKSRIGPGLLRNMSIIELVVYHREDKEINRVKEIKPAYIFQRIPFEVVRGAIGLFITELAQKTIKESEPNPDLYSFLITSFELLDQIDGRMANFHLAFMVQLTQYLGFMPNIEQIEELDSPHFYFDYKEGEFLVSPPNHGLYFQETNSQLLFQFMELGLAESAEISLNSESRNHFIEDLIRFYQYHVENMQMHSHEILRQVLS